MRLIRDVKGVSRLFLILYLVVSFIFGALLSYIWTIAYYAPQEFHLPSKSNVTIEKVEFDVQNATFFSVTALNPSYSTSTVEIKQILVSINASLMYRPMTTIPSLPFALAPGVSQTFMARFNWWAFTGQTFDVVALVADGSGATFQTRTPFMNLTVSDIDFSPSVTVNNFTVTVQSLGSLAYVNITNIFVNEEDVSAVTTPALAPYSLNPNSTVVFTVRRNWADLQNKNVTVAVLTLQGYTAYKTVLAPLPVALSIPSIVFNTTDTLHFNVTIHNDASSPVTVDITQVTVSVLGQTVTQIEISPPQPLQPGSDVLLTCSWDWSGYIGQNVTAAVTVHTLQGFTVSAEASIP